MSVVREFDTGEGSVSELKAALAQRERELAEAHGRETATAEVLKVINRAASDLSAVLDTLLATACRLCEADFGTIRYEEGDHYCLAATFNCPPEWKKRFAGYSSKPDLSSVFGQTIIKGRTVHIPDVLLDPDYARPDAQKLMGLRAALGVPLVRESRVFGVVTLFCTTPRAFTDRQIALVETFANQAVIAIENARLFEAERQRSAELAESLQQQTATSEVLKVISRSTFDLQTVLETLANSAGELCLAENVQIFLRDGELYRLAAHNGFSLEYQEFVKNHPIAPGRGAVVARTALTRTTVHVRDALTDPEYTYHEGRSLGGYRCLLGIPLLREGTCIGVMAMTRAAPLPFTEAQIALVSTFADQAVIAIENVRLFEAEQQRTKELGEALEQQTATSEVLKVISSSPGELQPVFDAMLKNATEICGAEYGQMFLHEDGDVHIVAQRNVPVALAAWDDKLGHHPPVPGGPLERLIIGKQQIVHISDVTAENNSAPAAKLGGAKTLLAVPMRKDGALVGAIIIYRLEVRPFTDKQIKLVQNFAAQAVIAVENTRLLSELRESLAQQTGTSEVLRIISSSPGELQPVFDTMLAKATELCEASYGVLWLWDGSTVRAAALHGALPEAYLERLRGGAAFLSHPDRPGTRAMTERKPIQVGDLREESAYRAGDPLAVAAADDAGIRTLVAVPMYKDDQVVGNITIYRREIRPFSDKQVDLLANFAAQAVIAIENTRLLSELRQRTDDLTETLEQQTATSEILQVISNSPTNSQPVFDTIVQSALRLFPDGAISIALPDGDMVKAVASNEADAERAAAWRAKFPVPLTRQFLNGIAILDARIVDIPDVRNAPPDVAAGALNFFEAGYLAVTTMPMMRGSEAIGALGIMRTTPGPLTDKQLALVKTFAAQAVIAIENARLFNELRQRTADLQESLEYQTATSEILTVISRSPTDATPVFDIIGERAEKLCDADVSVVSMVDGDLIQLAAIHGISSEGVEVMRSAYPLRRERETLTSRTVRSGKVIHVPDVLADPHYDMKNAARTAGYRGGLGVPMIRDGQVIGTIFVGRKTPGLYTDGQVQLLKTFADQAVIAIGNVRLFEEVQARTEDLQESLQQQTATADVLKVISRSTFDLQTVLNTLTESASRLCGADKGVISLLEGDAYVVRANYGFSAEAIRWAVEHPLRPGRDSMTGRVALEGKTVHIPDVLADPEYKATGHQQAFGYRTNLGVPLLRQGTTIGVFALTRDEVNPFTDKQMALATTFADQAVIAIENVRLFDEVQARTEDLQESLQQQTATADVLKVISRSTFDLRTVLLALVESAARLCDAEKTNITRERHGVFYRAEAFGFSEEFQNYVKDMPIEIQHGSAFGRALLESRVIHIPDVLADADYTQTEMQKLGAYRTVLAIPMMREKSTIGVLTLTRSEKRPFTDKQIELATTFADQAAIAIENVRLFDEIQEKSRQLEEASKHKSQFLANMSHELRTPLNAILGYTELIADGVYGDTPDKVKTTIQRIITNGKHLLGLINDVLDLSKIEAGQLSLSLADYSMKDVVYNVFGAVEPLASEKKLTFKADIAPDLPVGFGDERRLTQVLLNLVGNAIKFTDGGSVVIKAALKDDAFSVAVVDTGPGISEEDQKKLFQEFQQADSSTTKKKGGTGLGLAISKRIIEMHGGKVWLESRVGIGSTFTFTIPVRAEQQKRAAT